MEDYKKHLSRSLGGEKVTTKKDYLRMDKVTTCPPIMKKNLRRSINFHYSQLESATPLNILKSGIFSDLYDRHNQMPYVYQVFDIEGKVGGGSFGVVYKVKDKETSNIYAIKVSKNPGCKDMLTEVKNLEKVGEHPNIVKFYFAWKEIGHVYIQMEYCVSSLATYSMYNHNIQEPEIWDILLDMLHALKFLHSRMLVHLDVKPDNIMIATDGSYKLGDFGIMIDLEEFKLNPKRYSNEIYEGDSKYIAKEVLQMEYTPAADMFSLGISILELCTDVLLPNEGELWHLLRSGNLHQLHIKIPKSLHRAINCLMHPNKERRPTVDQIFSWRDVTRHISRREMVPRQNYFLQWTNHQESLGLPMPTISTAIASPLRMVMDAISQKLNNNNFRVRNLTREYNSFKEHSSKLFNDFEDDKAKDDDIEMDCCAINNSI